MIEIPEKLIMAKKLLERITRDKRTRSIEGHAGTFQNGREQGYKITHYKGLEMQTYYFAEARSTDDIVVYIGVKNATHGASEDAYENSRYFRYGNLDGAKEYIIKEMIAFEERAR